VQNCNVEKDAPKFPQHGDCRKHIHRTVRLSAPKDVSCAQPVLKQQSEEDFMSFLHRCFPQPFVSLMNLSRTNKMKICTFEGKGMPPSITPNVR
jgi:hypothetical protein